MIKNLNGEILHQEILHPVRKGVKNKKNHMKVCMYDGLYYVDRFWQEMGKLGELVFKLQFKRMAGQNELEFDHGVPHLHRDVQKLVHVVWMTFLKGKKRWSSGL